MAMCMSENKSFFIVKTKTDDKLIAIFVNEEDCKDFIGANFAIYYDEVVL